MIGRRLCLYSRGEGVGPPVGGSDAQLMKNLLLRSDDVRERVAIDLFNKYFL